ncbi:hypothetical protein [Neopusillimonas aromaticivorans]|uniref:hypothetical protein n=1 Tax=Neopusillimonas aromaticivorans TaxID=2979868 RepID=UPI002599719D|nr:hypothetical protein [Neopusillimonas aromaticivorans]WJJ93579.1 hypothetical protein N7E01_17040 [Neopusillimonas aromaticivorans]
MDALAHALKGGCPEIIAVLTEAVARLAVPEPSTEPVAEVEETSVELVESVRDGESGAPPTTVETPNSKAPPFWEETVVVVSTADDDSQLTEIEKSSTTVADTSSASVSVVAPKDEPNLFALDDEPLEYIFADDWEAEEEVSAPEGDAAVAEAARHVHEAIGRHKVVDRDEDWGDVDLHLPFRAAPLVRDEGDRVILPLNRSDRG